MKEVRADEIIQIPSGKMGLYTLPTGSFATMPSRQTKRLLTWYACREQFHRSVNKRTTKNFFFSFGNGEKDRVKEFVRLVEERIDVPKEDRCRVVGTNRANIVGVFPGTWWSQSIRLSFLTIAFRCGRSYDGDFQSALYSTPYTRETKPAVDRFVGGYTRFIGRGRMWVQAFSSYRNSTKIDYAERTLLKDHNV